LRHGDAHLRPRAPQRPGDPHDHRRRPAPHRRRRPADRRQEDRRAARKERMNQLVYLEDRWDDRAAAGLDGPELLRYRSNLLGADKRITNFGGGNTSAKLVEPDPLDGTPRDVLWVKGSGGDLGGIRRAGFATLYLGKLLALRDRYRGAAHEDEMVELYPLCT